MSEQATNTEKIQTLIAKIPSLSEAWSNAIEDQNDDTISDAWIATVEHFFPDAEDLGPESVLKLLKSKKLPCKNLSDFYHPIKFIADILIDLSDDLCFGEMERVLDYRCLQPEGAATICYYYIDMTKTLDGVSYCLSEEETEVESWLSSKRLSEADLVVICKDYEQEGIRSYASWTLAFSIEELGSSEKNIYSLFISHDDAFFYVEGPNSTGEYQIDPAKAFDYSSLKIDRNGTWKITEGQWDKEKILQHFEWQDLNIEWLASDEDEDEDGDEDEDEDEDESTYEDYTKAIELDPKDAKAYFNRGDAYSRLNKYPEAIADYTRTIELEPKNFAAYFNRGLAHNSLNNYPEAIADSSKAIEQDPTFALAYYYRGFAYYQLKKYPEAITDFTKIIELDPKDVGDDVLHAAAYNNRGKAYGDFKKYPEAIADYTKAIELDPEPAKTYFNRGNVYSSLQKYPEAILDYTKAIELDPMYALAHSNRGLAYKALGKTKEAEADFAKAKSLEK